MNIHRLKAKRVVCVAEEWRQLFIFKSTLTATDRCAEGLKDSGKLHKCNMLVVDAGAYITKKKGEPCLELLHGHREGEIAVGCVYGGGEGEGASSERVS